MNRSRLQLFTTTAATLIAAGFAQAALAQAQPTNDVAELVVTADKREQRLLDVPAPISAVSGDALVRQNAVGLNDYFRQVPGLALQPTGQGTQVVIVRGVTSGATSTGTGNTPSVGIYLDDIPLNGSTALGAADGITPDLDPSDLARVEVLKGPQGTLYGAGAMGGILKYATKAPNLTDFNGRIEVGGAQYFDHDSGGSIRGAVNLPLVQDRLALRASAFWRDEPGYIRDVQKGQDDTNSATAKGGAFALLAKPSEALSLTFQGLYQKRTGDDFSYVTYSAVTYQPFFGDLAHSSIPTAGQHATEFGVLGLTAKLDLGGHIVSSTTSYGENRYSFFHDFTAVIGGLIRASYGRPDISARLYDTFTTKKTTQEFKLASKPGGRLDYQVGVFYTDERTITTVDVQSVLTATGQLTATPTTFSGRNDPAYREYAGFGSLTYHVTDRFDVQAGMRWAKNKQSATSLQSGLIASGGSALVKSEEDVITFNVTPSYKLSDDVLAYARVATGYRPGGPNYQLGGAIPLTFESDRITNYEVGLKGTALERRAFFDVSLFYIDWKNPQQKGINANNFSYFANSGGAVSKGLDVSGQLQPMRGLTFTAAFNYTDSHLTETIPLATGIFARDGDQNPYSPKYSGSLGVEYRASLGSTAEGFVGADYAYVGDRLGGFNSTATLARFQLPSYHVINLRVGAEMDNGLSVNLALKNVGDQRGFIGNQGGNGTTISGVRTGNFVVTPPRAIVATIAKSF